MPTADQLAGVAEYGKARDAYERAERALIEMLAVIAATRSALEEALSRGDDDAAKDARARLRAEETRCDKAGAARDRAAAAITAARAQALDAGAGFDLLSSRHPLLLLPVRLETRFAWIDTAGERSFTESAGTSRALLVRIFPDDIHDDPHEPELTQDELVVLRELDKGLKASSDLRDLDAAWADAMRRVGPLRAGWLGEVLARGAPPARRPGKFSRPSVARLLPDSWLAIAELAGGTTVTEQSPFPVREPLETGPAPDGIDWMIDFDAALKAGMALVLEDLADVEITRLVVLGVRGTLDPDDSAAELERLLDAQHYTRGLGFLAPGTPTNSLPGVRAGHSTRPEPEDVLPLARRRFLIGMRPSPLCQTGDDSDAATLAMALGIDTSTFGYVERADATALRAGVDMRSLLATATRRRLALQLDDILDDDPLGRVLGFAVEAVSPTGHFPALRIGNQPYGLLPVLLRDDARIQPGTAAADLLPVLDRLRGLWDQAVDNVPRVGEPAANPGETVVRILQRDAVARRIAFRPLLGPKLGDRVAGRLGRPARFEGQREAAAQAIDALGAVDSLSSPLLDALHMDFAPSLTAPLVAPPDAPTTSRQHPAAYLDVVASLSPDRLLKHDYGGAERPRSLLFSFARLAMLAFADEAARATLINAGEDPERWDEEDVPGLGPGGYLATPLRRLEASDPGDPYGAPIAFHLSQGNSRHLADGMRETLDRLSGQPPELLEELLRANLGLFSHRLDPWYVGFAFERLIHEIRADPASSAGINVGAYGIVEHLGESPVQPAGAPGMYTSPLNGGYVHAPSVNQGAAAAVLRSVHLGHHAAGHGDAFSVDLSSERVRRGLELLEGIREGQPLAALLGYRIERGLAAERLQRLIAPLRNVAPLVANKLTLPAKPVETVAASNVIDGLTLLEDAGYDGSADPSRNTLWPKHSSLGPPLSNIEGDALDRVLGAARDALDAAADLAVAESVYQTVAGNPVRSGATVDGLSGAPVPPPEPAVVRTPRTGIGVTHRLLVLLGDSADSRGWPDTVRGLAEPRLESWARTTLPRPELIGIRARFLDGEGNEVASLEELTLASLQEEIREDDEALRIGALDLVLLADPDREPQRSSLEQRLAALIERVRPEEAENATLALVYERHRRWDENTFGIVEVSEIARQLRDAISRGRALEPQDLELASTAPSRMVDIAELASRAQGAAGALAGAITGLQAVATSKNAGDIRRTLFRADALGIAGAAPDTIRDTPGGSEEVRQARAVELKGLQAQVKAALAEARRREAALAGLPAADAEQRLQTVFGEAFTVLPALAAGSLSAGPVGKGMEPAGGDAAAARTWLSRAAPVRAASAALNAVLGYADAVAAVDAKAPVAALHVGQLGGEVNEPWVGLPPDPGESVPAGRVSLVAVIPDGGPPGDAVAGLFVDEWVEVIPSAEETTSVTFHYDAPTACAPQVMLLGVPPPGLEAWGPAEALRIVEEAHALARIRLVDLDDVPDLGQLVPALVTDENPAGDAIGLDVEVLTEEAP